MKNIIKLLITAFILTFGTTNLMAGAGHSHNADEAKIERNAKAKIVNLIKKQKLDTSWNESKLVSMKKKLYGGKSEWIVTYKNNQVADTSRQTIYVYLTSYGKVIGANFKK